MWTSRLTMRGSAEPDEGAARQAGGWSKLPTDVVMSRCWRYGSAVHGYNFQTWSNVADRIVVRPGRYHVIDRLTEADPAGGDGQGWEAARACIPRRRRRALERVCQLTAAGP
jgi:hypothetical protein